MVGSIMFPTSYKGITDVLHKKIEVKEKGNTDIFTQADTEVLKNYLEECKINSDEIINLSLPFFNCSVESSPLTLKDPLPVL